MYTDKGTIQKYLAIDINSSFDAQITSWISTVKTWIDTYCGKTFEAVTGTKYYDGNGCADLLVDDFIDGTITELSVLDNDGVVERTLTEGQSNDYLEYPINESWHNELKLVVGASYAVWPTGDRRVKLTADFGRSATVPADIALIATKLVSAIIEKGLDGGKLSSKKLDDLQVNMQMIDEAVEPLGIYNTLDQYRDITI